MEPATGLTILGGAIGSAKVLEKLLGPTADYLGGGIKNYTEKGLGNLKRVFSHAESTLGKKIEEPGQVPPKVLKGILEEGYFAEDQLSAQYFGGVLASSRTGVNRDDRGASFIQLVGRLSTYQIRAHFIFYTLFTRLCSGRSENLGILDERRKLKIWIPGTLFVIAMDFQSDEDLKVLTTHTMDGLVREALIDEEWAAGSMAHIKKFSRLKVDTNGIVFHPSPVELELYLWAHGVSSVSAGNFLAADFSPMALDGMAIPEGEKLYAPDINIST
ncbi:MAG: hypothetical protein HOL31_10365 [Candidatus Scalindua sp.]|nr:hypothetical protein [Candidatus Scalindua sp.]